MRIIFFTHYFPPEGNAPACRTYEHCLRWVQAGHQVTVITCQPNVPDGIVYEGYRNRLWPQRERLDGIDVIRVWTYLAANAGNTKRILNFASYLFSATFAFLFFCRRPNIIISTSPQFFCGWTGTVCSWLGWRKFILEIRDIWPESIVTVGAMKNGPVIRFLERLEKWMYLSAHHIVAVGEGYRQNILSKVPIADRVSVVTNGVDPERFQPAPKSDEFLDRYGLRDKFVCSYVGTIGMAHALDVTVRAAKRLKANDRRDIVFWLVGDGAKRLELEASVHAEGLTDWVKFSGRLPKEDMAEVLATSDCLLVHLKKTELFETVIPSKIFEAMAMNRPIVMGVRGEAADIVRRSGSGVDLEPDNDQELSEILIRLCDDREFHDSLGHSGRDFIKREYTRDVLASKFLNIIETIAR